MSDPLASLRRKTRLVAEVRYPAVPSLFDRRGQVIERINPEIEKRFPVWSLEASSIKWTDRPVPIPGLSEFAIGFRQTSFIVEDVTMHDFSDMVQKHMRLAYDALTPGLKHVALVGDPPETVGALVHLIRHVAVRLAVLLVGVALHQPALRVECPFECDR